MRFCCCRHHEDNVAAGTAEGGGEGAPLNQGSSITLLCPYLWQQEQQALCKWCFSWFSSQLCPLSLPMTGAAKPWPSPQPWGDKINICLRFAPPDLGRLHPGDKWDTLCICLYVSGWFSESLPLVKAWLLYVPDNLCSYTQALCLWWSCE